eukprot:Lankesteria_metandrocarpae@DN10623_c0_g1_i1.p1
MKAAAPLYDTGQCQHTAGSNNCINQLLLPSLSKLSISPELLRSTTGLLTTPRPATLHITPGWQAATLLPVHTSLNNSTGATGGIGASGNARGHTDKECSCCGKATAAADMCTTSTAAVNSVASVGNSGGGVCSSCCTRWLSTSVCCQAVPVVPSIDVLKAFGAQHDQQPLTEGVDNKQSASSTCEDDAAVPLQYPSRVLGSLSLLADVANALMNTCSITDYETLIARLHKETATSSRSASATTDAQLLNPTALLLFNHTSQREQQCNNYSNGRDESYYSCSTPQQHNGLHHDCDKIPETRNAG